MKTNTSNTITSNSFNPAALTSPVLGAETAFDPTYAAGLSNEAGRLILLPIRGFLTLFYTTVFLFFMFVLRELLELIAEGPKRYFSFFENIFEVFVICLTTLCFIFLESYSHNQYFYELLQVAVL